MKSTVWRTVLLSMCAVTALTAIVAILSVTGFGGKPPWSGHWGMDVAPIPFGRNVADVDPGGPADRGGLRAGDAIDLRDYPLQERYWINSRAFNGRPFVLSVQRGAVQKKIVVTPTPISSQGDWQRLWINGLVFFAQPALVLWLSFFTALIAWRRSGVPEMRLLALTLIFYTASSFAVIYEWTTPWLWTSIAQDFTGDVAVLLAIAFWVALSNSYGRPLSVTRRVVQSLCYAMIAVQIALNVASSIGFTTLRFDWNSAIFTTNDLFYAIVSMALVSSVFGITASRGEERQRSVWILGLVSILMVVVTGGNILSLLPSSYYLSNLTGDIQTLVSFVVPAALTYAALSRRVIDIGFVLNRSVVFAIVSAIVVVTFIAVEWAAGAWLTGMTRTTSALLGLGAALGLGLSMRYIHGGVDRFVDRSFFWKRHNDEEALRRFAHESAYITNRSALLDRTVEEIRMRTHAQEISILLPDGLASYASAQSNGEYSSLSENDSGIVALRAWHKPVEIHKLANSSLHGELAFPMVSRGMLVGVLVCGPKRDGEAYAPDEIQALEAVTHGVAAALDTMTGPPIVAVTGISEAILARLDLLLAEVRSMREPDTRRLS